MQIPPFAKRIVKGLLNSPSVRAARMPGARNRGRSIERLEDRRLMVAEGEVFQLAQLVDASSLTGELSATVDWGDGRSTPGIFQSTPGADAIQFAFDYRYDTGQNAFFDTPEKKALLQAAADSLAAQLKDQLTAIVPTGDNEWTAQFFHPVTGVIESLEGLTIAENRILVFVGARDLPGNQRGLGGPGGFGATGDSTWLEAVRGRGQAGALASPQTDSAPWGGSIAFDNGAETDWYFGLDASEIGSDQRDFFTFAVHELAHVLGIGYTAPGDNVSAWENLASSNGFAGPQARTEYDLAGLPPLDVGGLDHWADGLMDEGRTALMGPNISSGERTSMTPLDFAALEDLGWEFGWSDVTVVASHPYADDGQYPIRLTVVDSTGTNLVRTSFADVTNVAPQLTVPSSATATPGVPLTISSMGQISDSGFANDAANPPTTESFTYSIDWGDGTAAQSGNAEVTRAGGAALPTLAQFDGTHTYQIAGEYTVQITVQDDDGGTDQQSFPVSVGDPRNPLTTRFAEKEYGENTGADSIELIVERLAEHAAQELNFTVTGGNGRVSYAGNARILAGQTSTTVAMTPTNDAIKQNMEKLSFSIQASGYLQADAEVRLLDDENEFQNTTDRFNVNGDGQVSALDALVVINALNRPETVFELRDRQATGSDSFWDVNGDYRITALDALNVINEINRNASPTSQSASSEPLATLAQAQYSDRSGEDDDVSSLHDRVISELSATGNLF